MWLSNIPAIVYKEGKPTNVTISFDSSRATIVTDPETTGHIGNKTVDPDARIEPDDPKNVLYIDRFTFQDIVIITDKTKKEIEDRLAFEDMIRVRGLYPIH